MDWLRANYDRAAALAAALFLILCAVFIFLGASGFSEKFSALQSVPPPNNKIPADHAPEIVEAMEQLQAARRSGLPAGRPGSSFRKSILSARMVSPRPCRTRSSIRPCLTNGWRNSVFPSPRPTFSPRMSMATASPISTSGMATPTRPIRNSHPPYTCEAQVALLRAGGVSAYFLVLGR